MEDEREELNPTPQAEPETAEHDGGSGTPSFDEWLDSNPAYRSEFDRRVTKGVNTARAKWEREQTEAQDEATKLARMTAAQKERYQLDKDKAAFAAQQAQFQRQQLEVQMGRDLQSRGMDAGFAQWLTGADAEASAANLKAFEALWNAAISSAVTGRMRGTTPPKEPDRAEVTRESLRHMTPQEINKAYESGQLDALMGRK